MLTAVQTPPLESAFPPRWNPWAPASALSILLPVATTMLPPRPTYPFPPRGGPPLELGSASLSQVRCAPASCRITTAGLSAFSFTPTFVVVVAPTATFTSLTGSILKPARLPAACTWRSTPALTPAIPTGPTWTPRETGRLAGLVMPIISGKVAAMPLVRPALVATTAEAIAGRLVPTPRWTFGIAELLLAFGIARDPRATLSVGFKPKGEPAAP